MDFNIIKVNWLDKKTYDLNSLSSEQEYSNCLYQAYGDSPIYGSDVLLYIGQTNSFRRRTEEHLKSDFNRINNLKLIVGELNFQEYQNLTTSEVLDISESILITMLKPSYNSSNIKDTNFKAKEGIKFLVLNLGNRNSLPLELSNYWW